jgi:hypothetical protein
MVFIMVVGTINIDNDRIHRKIAGLEILIAMQMQWYDK